MTFYPHYSLSHFSKKTGTNSLKKANFEEKKRRTKEKNNKNRKKQQKSKKTEKRAKIEKKRKNRQKEQKARSRRDQKNQKKARGSIPCIWISKDSTKSENNEFPGDGEGKKRSKIFAQKSDFFRKKVTFLTHFALIAGGLFSFLKKFFGPFGEIHEKTRFLHIRLKTGPYIEP